MENAGAIGYQLAQELISLREQVRRIIHDEVIPAESRVDPDAAEILDDDYWAIAKKTQAAGMWCMGSPVNAETPIARSKVADLTRDPELREMLAVELATWAARRWSRQ